MKLELVAVTVLALGSACSAPMKTSKTPDLPTLQAAAVLGPFEDEATLCRTIYTAGPDCLKRSKDLVQGPTRVTGEGLGRVEIVEAWTGDHRCAILFEVAGRLYLHPAPAFCLSQGHSVYVPTVRELAFRDLDRVHPPDLVIVADVQIIIDETEDAPPRTTPPLPPFTMAMFCGRRGGSTPSCVEVTTPNPEAFVASHGFHFQ